MKSFFKLLGFIVLVAVIGFSTVGCVVPDDNDSGGKNSGNKNDDGSGGNGTNTGKDNSGSKTPGSTSENPILVTVGYSASHTISSTGEHWFKFTGTGDPVIFETTGNVVDTYMVMWDDYEYVNTSWTFPIVAYNDNDGEGNNALCSFTTKSGKTYWIKITARNSTSGSFTFIVE